MAAGAAGVVINVWGLGFRFVGEEDYNFTDLGSSARCSFCSGK